MKKKATKQNESGLTKHAERELKIAGLFNKDSDYHGEIGVAVMELIKVFSNQGHSGFSASQVSSIFHRLANYETISPLTGENDEWNLVEEDLYQNNRNFAVFKCGKNSQAYYVDAIVWRQQDGLTYTGKVSGIGSAQYIKSFPFQPVTFYIDVTDKEVKKDDFVSEINNKDDLNKVWEVYDQKTIKIKKTISMI